MLAIFPYNFVEFAGKGNTLAAVVCDGDVDLVALVILDCRRHACVQLSVHARHVPRPALDCRYHVSAVAVRGAEILSQM